MTATLATETPGSDASITFRAPYAEGDQDQVQVTARASHGTQDHVIQGWFNRGALEDALAASRPAGREIVLEPAA